jgi:prepilin-type N-terminal cleavage/methylation domain-containing protein
MKLPDRNQKLILSGDSVKGFTLIEVLVVMAIMFGLAGIGYSVFFKINETAKENETGVMLQAVASAMDARSVDISSTQRDDVGVQTGLTFPDGDGSETSSEVLVNYISGDFDGDGNIDLGTKTKETKVVRGLKVKGSYIKEIDGRWLIVDSWNTPIRFTFPGDYHNEDDGFDLESAGPDREFGSGSTDPLSKDNIILK